MRLDQYLVETNMVQTRAKAQDAIKEGRVLVNQRIITKNSFALKETDEVKFQEADLSFVSRAGFKLYDVIEDFGLHLQDRVCMDVGASTGGFSDVCLREGARLVYALDVGKDQLSKELIHHPRLVNREQINCRYLKKEMFDPRPTFACMDVSFISIKLLLPVLKEVLEQVEIVALIKPQFEAGKEHIGKHGIVKDKKVHVQVLSDMVSYVQSLGLYVHHIQGSSILGRDGNKEFIMHIKEEPKAQLFDIKRIIEEHQIKR